MKPDLLTAGVDEVGMGPLAGPVVAAAVILGRYCRIRGLADSKVLSAEEREELAEKIKARAVCWAIGRAEVAEIEQLNILRAGLLAMERAVAQLQPAPDLALVDGNRPPQLLCRVKTIIKGDASVPAISAASIIAKVARDAEMRAMDAHYPGYDFASHKGYPTPAHIEALNRLGPSPIHRRTYTPVRRLFIDDTAVDDFDADALLPQS